MEASIPSPLYLLLFPKVNSSAISPFLKNEDLCEDDLKHFILEDYTFLKRPVILVNDSIFIGHSRKNLEDLRNMMEGCH